MNLSRCRKFHLLSALSKWSNAWNYWSSISSNYMTHLLLCTSLLFLDGSQSSYYWEPLPSHANSHAFNWLHTKFAFFRSKLQFVWYWILGIDIHLTFTCKVPRLELFTQTLHISDLICSQKTAVCLIANTWCIFDPVSNLKLVNNFIVRTKCTCPFSG